MSGGFDDLDDDDDGSAAEQGSGYQYFERDNMLFRGKPLPGYTKGCPSTETLVGGQWKPSSLDFGLKAQMYGSKLTEDEAREWAGEDWPGETMD